MAYSQINATDTDDLLDQIASFLSSNGWTVANSSDTGTGWSLGRQLCLTAPSTNYFFNMYSDLSGKYIWTSVSGSVGSTTNDKGSQPTESPQSRTNFIVNNYQNVWLFADGDSFFCVVEFETQKFRHFCVGVLDKAGGDGAWVGGQFSQGTHWDQASYRINVSTTGFHAVPFDSEGDEDISYNNIVRVRLNGSDYDRRFNENTNTNKAFGNVRPNVAYYCPYILSSIYSYRNSIGRTAIFPITITVRDHTDNYWVPLGTVPNARVVDFDGIAPKDIITLGSDNWHCFPISQKNGASPDENSGTFGIAYKEVP